MEKDKIQELNSFSSQIRRSIVRMVHALNSGHPGGSLGCVEYFTSLYQGIMNHNSSFKMDGVNEDLFFLSMGIYRLYSTLYWHDLDISLLKN